MNLDFYYLRPSSGFVFSVCLRVAEGAAAMQIGFCRGVTITGPHAFPEGGFKRGTNIALTQAWAEPLEFGWLPLDGLLFNPVSTPPWMAHPKPSREIL